MREDEADSLVRLGKDYLHIRNYDKAMEYLGHAVMLGKTNAAQDLYALGKHFLAEKNYKKAEEAFQMLADRGHGESCLILGEMCEKGLGRQRDYQAAFGFYSESFQQGVDRGAYRAGMLMREDALRVVEVRDIALTWLEEAIKAGIYGAYAAVGDLYSEHFTAGSTPRDDQEAFSWYMKGAMRGDALCLFRVAVCFAEGYGTKPDIPRALRLYRQAADAGSALACRQLGEMYAAGIHVHREIRRALTWFLRAYELGDQGEKRAAAIGMLGVVQAYIDTPRYEEVEELLHSFLEKLHAAGDTSCLFALADIERRRGRMDLYLKDLEKGMQAGHDSCRERWVQYYMNEVVTELRVLEPIFDELAERDLQITLSVSLHAPDDETRSRLMPANRGRGVDELMKCCRRYYEKTGRRISFEYAMIDGVNDTEYHARLLAKHARSVCAHVNLIPLNHVEEREFKPSTAGHMKAFIKILEDNGVNVTVRRKLGGDVDASCGQLRRKMQLKK